MNNEESNFGGRNLTARLFAGFDVENVKENLEICNYWVNLKLLASSKGTHVENIVEECLNDLRENSVRVKTVKAQVFWSEKYKSKDEVKKIHHETIYKNVLPILTEIVERGRFKMSDRETYYRKIVIFIIMFAGLGSPTQPAIIKETQAALHSIFKNTELDNFLTLSKPLKEEQLFEYARIVTGIRLFNKDCKKGGEGIEDLPLILTQGVSVTKDRILQLKAKVDKRIRRLLNVCYHVYGLGETAEKIQINFAREKLDELKNVLSHFRQTECCLKDIVEDLNDSIIIIEELVKKFQLVLLRVHDVVRYRVAIATAKVFPLFLQLSDIWVEMQEEVDVLSEINNNFAALSSIVEFTSPTTVEKAFRPMFESLVPLKPGNLYDDHEFVADVRVCTGSAIPLETSIQYRGYCAWTLAQTEGVLLQGDMFIGVLSFENRFYSFFSAEAAHKWAMNPKFYIEAVLGIVKLKPELISLLNIADDLRLERVDFKESTIREEPKREALNVEIQTDLHPIDSHISRNYTFSEWELRRRALKLASLTKCKTKSQQTIRSSFQRREVGVQITETFSKETQTRRPVVCRTCFPKSKV